MENIKKNWKFSNDKCLCAACTVVNFLPVLINWPLMKVASLEEASLSLSDIPASICSRALFKSRENKEYEAELQIDWDL